MRHAPLETGGRDSAKTGEGGWASWTAQALFAWTRTHDEPRKSETFGYIAAGLLCADVSFTHCALAQIWDVGAKASHGNNRLFDACFRVFARCAKKKIFNSFTSFSRWKWFILTTLISSLLSQTGPSTLTGSLLSQTGSLTLTSPLLFQSGPPTLASFWAGPGCRPWLFVAESNRVVDPGRFIVESNWIINPGWFVAESDRAVNPGWFIPEPDQTIGISVWLSLRELSLPLSGCAGSLPKFIIEFWNWAL